MCSNNNLADGSLMFVIYINKFLCRGGGQQQKSHCISGHFGQFRSSSQLLDLHRKERKPVQYLTYENEKLKGTVKY